MKIKKLFISLLCVMCISVATAQPPKAEYLGVIAELSFIKNSSENLARRVINDTSISDRDKINFVILYNDLKAISDQIISQIIADSRRKNHLKNYKLIDDLFCFYKISEMNGIMTTNAKVKTYLMHFTSINFLHTQLLDFRSASNPNEKISLTANLSGLFEYHHSQVSDNNAVTLSTQTILTRRAVREIRVSNVTRLLESTKLSPIQDLTVPLVK
jgi:hypothetical protein